MISLFLHCRPTASNLKETKTGQLLSAKGCSRHLSSWLCFGATLDVFPTLHPFNICREFPSAEGSGARVNGTGVFSTLDEMILLVEKERRWGHVRGFGF